jgi:hypothetical protein
MILIQNQQEGRACDRYCIDIFRLHVASTVMKTYRGSCHCGKIRFEMDTEIDHVRVCDYSICRRRGTLNHRVPQERLRLLTLWSDLVPHQWSSRTARDYFCPVCSILPFGRPSDPTPQELREGVQPFDG